MGWFWISESLAEAEDDALDSAAGMERGMLLDTCWPGGQASPLEAGSRKERGPAVSKLLLPAQSGCRADVEYITVEGLDTDAALCSLA